MPNDSRSSNHLRKRLAVIENVPFETIRKQRKMLEGSKISVTLPYYIVLWIILFRTLSFTCQEPTRNEVYSTLLSSQN